MNKQDIYTLCTLIPSWTITAVTTCIYAVNVTDSTSVADVKRKSGKHQRGAST